MGVVRDPSPTLPVCLTPPTIFQHSVQGFPLIHGSPSPISHFSLPVLRDLNILLLLPHYTSYMHCFVRTPAILDALFVFNRLTSHIEQVNSSREHGLATLTSPECLAKKKATY